MIIGAAYKADKATPAAEYGREVPHDLDGWCTHGSIASLRGLQRAAQNFPQSPRHHLHGLHNLHQGLRD